MNSSDKDRLSGTFNYPDADTIESESYIGKSVKIKGNLISDGKIIISGKITGNISANGETVIEKQGNVRGKIESKFIDVFGSINGTVKSDGKVTFHSSGNFKGDLEYKVIEVKEGAVINGTANKNK